MLLIADEKLDYKDVLIVPQRSSLDSRSGVDLLREYKFPHCKLPLKCTGIIASNMWNIGTCDMAYSLAKYNCLTAINKYIKEENWHQLYKDKSFDGRFFFTVGESNEDLDTLKWVFSPSLECNRFMFCVDVANGYRASFIDYIKKIRTIVGCEAAIMAGNVTTPEMTQELILAGADIVKIGIGPGSACQTRRVTGVGYPMLSAIFECANAAHGLGGHICADGGCREPGDICKAFCAGADFVMIGGMLAGTDECQGEWLYRNVVEYHYNDIKEENRRWPFVEGNIMGVNIDAGRGIACTFDKNKDGLIEHGEKTKLKFFGMSSDEAMKKFGGSDKHYRASEGSEVWVDAKGPASNVIEEILGGLRSCGTYIGAKNLKDFPKCSTFVKIR